MKRGKEKHIEDYDIPVQLVVEWAEGRARMESAQLDLMSFLKTLYILRVSNLISEF